MQPVVVTAAIVNKKGLHARAAAKFVKTVGSFDAEVRVRTLEEGVAQVGGSSILGLMMLGADKGTELEITVSGAQAAEVATALQELIANKFGEDE